MRFEHFEEDDTQDPKILRNIEKIKESSNDALESIGQGFDFPVPEKVRNINEAEKYDIDSAGHEAIGKKDLIKTSLRALKFAWERAIEPQIGNVRTQGVQNLKQGADFFTQADVDGEEEIKKTFNEAFGEDKIQIFGEEANEYKGNHNSQISVRVDPIDGTQSFKFGEPDWGIMIGVYHGELGKERQVISATYLPEKDTIVYGIEGVGTFVSDLTKGQTKEIKEIEKQDDLKDLIISYWKHSDFEQRGPNDLIQNALTREGARIHDNKSPCGDVLEALITRGQRVIIYDGDMSIVDYIPYPLIERMGYKIYGWDGDEYRAEDPDLKNKKVVIVPPGQAGEQVRTVIRNIMSAQNA